MNYLPGVCLKKKETKPKLIVKNDKFSNLNEYLSFLCKETVGMEGCCEVKQRTLLDGIKKLSLHERTNEQTKIKGTKLVGWKATIKKQASRHTYRWIDLLVFRNDE